MTARFEWRTSLCAADFPAAAYEALRLRVTDHTPFNHLGWLCAAEQALSAGESLHILLGWEADELRLCLPDVYKRQLWRGRLRSNTPCPSQKVRLRRIEALNGRP